MKQLSWKVGGQQGEGIDSAGETLATTLSRGGYHLYAYRHFSSRIKGGHSNTKIRISNVPVHAMAKDLDILVAFDQETIDLNAHELIKKGIILADEKFNPQLPEGIEAKLCVIPFTAIATEIGMAQMKNIVSVGASGALLGLDLNLFRDVLSDRFKKKGEAVVEKNMAAIFKGAEFVNESLDQETLSTYNLGFSDGQKRAYMIGNDAISVGAIMGGARFMAAYPITPSSEIMEYLIKKLPKFGGTVIQTEDEIAAINMIIGANYGGVRSLTASAGPGLSLMTEAIGLAGMTETPLVIVNTQRGGPSTGLPTKQEQSDLMAMLYSTHGEIPKIVLAPSTVEECFYDTIEAFNLAEIYQCPVIILTDLALSLGKETVEPFDYDEITVDRGNLVTKEEDLPELEKSELFPRYKFSSDGISKRVLPGKKYGLHHVTGVEHNEVGRPFEDAKNRLKMMDKRLSKLEQKESILKTPLIYNTPHDQADILIIGFISTKGAISEAVEVLNSDGIKTNHVHIKQLMPFPKTLLNEVVEKADKVIVVENNATAQLASIIQMNLGIKQINKFIKYDGTPFVSNEIYDYCKELLVHGHL